MRSARRGPPSSPSRGAARGAGRAAGGVGSGGAGPLVAPFGVARVVAVAAVQVDTAQLGEAPPELRKLSWSGPVLVGAREARDGETLDSVMLSLKGVEPSARPGWWQAYDK